jgi:hypothetical protein
VTAKWQAGHTYVPGDLVVPSSSSITTPTLANPDFESGDTGWDKTGTWSIDATGVPYHGSWDATAIANGEIINQDVNAIAAGISVTASCAVKSHGITGTNMQAMIVWYSDDAGTVRLTGQDALGNGNTLHDTQQISTVTAKAPAGAKSFRIGAKATIVGTGGMGTNYSVCDYFSVSCAQSVPKGLVFKATQANPGKSGASEPTWPATTGVPVTDNEVTWEGVIATRVVWEAQPLLKSGDTEPTWPDSDDGAVHDSIIDWQAVTPRITDSLCPQSKIVTIAANKVFVGDGDVVKYCATNDATDWHSEQDAGYLPTGLQAVGETQCTALGIYRGNVVAWTASSMEVWQVDPDPSRMAIIDTVEGVGTTFVRAAIGMMNDLFFLSPLGVRSVSTSATTGTMGAADVGSPVDPLVVAAINTAIGAGIDPVGVFYSNASQFWVFLGAEAYVYTISQATGIKAWSRYTFPWSVTHACVKDGQLYVRTSDNDVYVLDETYEKDDVGASSNQMYEVAVQWPWLDLSSAGVEKMICGVDCVVDQDATTTTSIQLGYNENDPSAFTVPVSITTDTRPGQIVPIPVAGVTFAPKITHTSDKDWTLSAFTIYYNTMRMTA